MAEVEVPLAEGETFEELARRHGIDDWVDLWDYNRARLEAAGLPDPNRLPAGTRIFLPDDRDHELGRRLLAARGVPVEEYLGGTSWLDPRGVVSITILDDDGVPFPDGTEVVIEDPDLGTRTVERVVAGALNVRLPRKPWTLRVIQSSDFERSHGWFRDAYRPGDSAATHLAGDPRTRPAGPAVDATTDEPPIGASGLRAEQAASASTAADRADDPSCTAGSGQSTAAPDEVVERRVRPGWSW